MSRKNNYIEIIINNCSSKVVAKSNLRNKNWTRNDGGNVIRHEINPMTSCVGLKRMNVN